MYLWLINFVWIFLAETEPKFYKNPFPKPVETVMVGQDIKWECLAAGRPQPEITWLKVSYFSYFFAKKN